MGFVVNKVIVGQFFSEHFGFPLPVIIPPLLHIHIIRGWYSRPS
jgi:hypothetical protein